MNEELKKQIIIYHYQNPKHKYLVNNDNYEKINMNSESCIDEIELMVKLDGDIVKDICFDGEACAICTSSTSIMVETLIGKKISEVKEILKNYFNMIDEKDYNGEILEQAIVYRDIGKQPNRKKCATLSWIGIERILGSRK